jgi:transcription termination factor 2
METKKVEDLEKQLAGLKVSEKKKNEPIRKIKEIRMDQVLLIESQQQEAIREALKMKESCLKPSNTTPEALTSTLYPHQLQALQWMTFREADKSKYVPTGGILCDEMGLGKTLTTIALIVSTKKAKTLSSLLICPKSLLSQWESEIKKHTKKGSLKVNRFYGPSKDEDFLKYDVILTTYETVHNSIGMLERFSWERIVLDEGHRIKNSEAQTSISICKLPAKYRWVLSGKLVESIE